MFFVPYNSSYPSIKEVLKNHQNYGANKCVGFFSVHILIENKLRHKAQSQYITDKKKHIYFLLTRQKQNNI